MLAIGLSSDILRVALALFIELRAKTSYLNLIIASNTTFVPILNIINCLLLIFTVTYSRLEYIRLLSLRLRVLL